MAPSTRLGARPERRLNYSEDTPPSDASTMRTKSKAATSKRLSKSQTAKVVKTTPSKPKKVVPQKTECIICATTKDTKRSFKVADEVTCEHFENICSLCIQKQIKTNIAERRLADAHLPCMFPECKTVLDHATLKNIMTKALFKTWDTAVTKHLLAASPSYIACLNPKCGIYFSTEACGSTHPKTSKSQDSADKASCPYCSHELCLSCNRPWHQDSDCNKAKKREDKKSEKAIKDMGAKPCPKCGINIEKQGGCDHMACQRCRHNFCWECLAPYTAHDTHLETCSHRRPMIAHDIANFAAGELTDAQVNQLIQRAHRDRDRGRQPQGLADAEAVMQRVLDRLPPPPPPVARHGHDIVPRDEELVLRPPVVQQAQGPVFGAPPVRLPPQNPPPPIVQPFHQILGFFWWGGAAQ